VEALDRSRASGKREIVIEHVRVASLRHQDLRQPIANPVPQHGGVERRVGAQPTSPAERRPRRERVVVDRVEVGVGGERPPAAAVDIDAVERQLLRAIEAEDTLAAVPVSPEADGLRFFDVQRAAIVEACLDVDGIPRQRAFWRSQCDGGDRQHAERTDEGACHLSRGRHGGDERHPTASSASRRESNEPVTGRVPRSAAACERAYVARTRAAGKPLVCLSDGAQASTPVQTKAPWTGKRIPQGAMKMYERNYYELEGGRAWSPGTRRLIPACRPPCGLREPVGGCPVITARITSRAVPTRGDRRRCRNRLFFTVR